MNDGDRASRVESVFAETLSQPAGARTAYLSESCGTDAALRAEVESLLRAHEEAGEFLALSPDAVSPSVPAGGLATDSLPTNFGPPPIAGGTMLGAFEITAPLGAGGMGAVYRARDTRLDRSVAIKVLTPRYGGIAGEHQRFEREARAISRLSHPHICALYDVGRATLSEGAEPIEFLVMELVDGVTLADRLSQGPLPLSQAVQFAAEIAEALACAHREGIVHRDLKPQNIMVNANGTKLLDFGLAAFTHPSLTAQTPVLTSPGLLLGTVQYMAPEQIQGREVDARADLFSLGLVMYEMVSGQRAYRRPSSVETLNAILHDDPPPLPDSLPAPVTLVIAHCLEKAPERRFQTARDLAFALRSLVLSGLVPAIAAPGGAQDLRGPDTAAAPADDGARAARWFHGRAVQIAAVITLLAAAGIAAWRIRPWEQGSKTSHGPAVRRTLTRLTFGPGLQTDPTFAPDGRYIAYASDRAGTFDIWVQSVAGGDPVQVTRSPANELTPDWSANGSTIVFATDKDGGGIFTVPALGGREHRVTSFGSLPRWSPDGTRIAFLDAPPTTSSGNSNPWTAAPGGSKVYVVSPSGTDAHEVLAPVTSGGRWFDLAWHPDGRLSIYGERATEGPAIYTASLDGQHVTRTAGRELAEWNNLSRFRWGPDGSSLYVADTAHGNVCNVWRVTVQPDSLAWLSAERVTTGYAEYGPVIAPTGRSMAYSQINGTNGFWIFPFDSSRQQIGEGRAFLERDDATPDSADLTEDGERIAYSVQERGSQASEFHVQSIRTGTTELLLRDEFIRSSARWSPDGTAIVYKRARWLEQGDLSLVVLDPDHRERVIAQTRADVLAPSDWTPDGQRIVSSFRAAAADDLSLVTWDVHPSHPQSQASTTLLHAQGRSVWGARYSPNGRWISLVYSDAATRGEAHVALVPAAGAPPADWRRIPGEASWSDKPRWSPDGRTLYYVANVSQPFFDVCAVAIDPLTGRVADNPVRLTHFDRAAFALVSDHEFEMLHVAPNRLVLEMVRLSGSIWMIDNVSQ